MSYKIKLDIFEGPLDLLLYLIKKNDLDISNIAISKVTEQYMQYIDMMKMLDLNVVGDFLVIAATLMQIKSHSLLPVDPSAELAQEEDPEDELLRRLNEYQKFKEIAEALKNKELERQKLYARNIDQEEIQKIREDSKEIYFESNLFDLITALTDALKKVPEDILHEIFIEEHTIDQKVHDILHILLDGSAVILSNLFNKCRSKIEMVVTFLAVLELIRLKEIKIFQKRLFADIEIMRNKDNMIPVEESKQVISDKQ